MECSHYFFSLPESSLLLFSLSLFFSRRIFGLILPSAFGLFRSQKTAIFNSGMSFVPEISSFVLHRHNKINWRAQPQAKFSLAWFCFAPDQIHMRYSLQTTKNNNNLWFHLNFQSVWVFGELSPSPCSRVFTSAASVDCSAHSYLFSSAIARLAVHKNCFNMWH